MSAQRLAGRYAKSLLDLASEQGSLDQVVRDVQTLKDSLASRELYLLLKSPIVNSAKKQSIFNTLFSGSMSELTQKFLSRVIAKRREGFIPEMTTAFMDLYRQKQGITRVDVTLAAEPSEELVNTIRDRVQSAGLASGPIELHTSIDPSIIGGFIIELGDRRLDESVAHRLSTLRKNFSR